jgi:hypothetical protein
MHDVVAMDDFEVPMESTFQKHIKSRDCNCGSLKKIHKFFILLLISMLLEIFNFRDFITYLYVFYSSYYILKVMNELKFWENYILILNYVHYFLIMLRTHAILDDIVLILDLNIHPSFGGKVKSIFLSPCLHKQIGK